MRLVQRLEDAGYDHLLVYDHVLGADIEQPSELDRLLQLRRPVPRAAGVVRVRRSRVLARARDRRPRVAPTPERAAWPNRSRRSRCSRPAASASVSASGGTTSSTRRSASTSDAAAARIEEQIPLLRRLWTEPSLDHTGTTESIDAAGLAPRPRDPVPIWIGCGTDSRAVARASGAWPTDGCQNRLSNLVAASNPHGSRCAPPPARAGRDPDALGLEGQLWSPPEQESRLPDRLARWRDAGADAVGINTGRAGIPWSDDQLDALLRAADAMP